MPPLGIHIRQLASKVHLLAAEEELMNKRLTAIGCFAVGAGIGATLGLLFAPRAGKHTRARLCNSASRTLNRVDEIRENVREHLSELVDDVSETVVSNIGGCKQTVSESGERVQKALDQVRERIDRGRERVEEYVRSFAG